MPEQSIENFTGSKEMENPLETVCPSLEQLELPASFNNILFDGVDVETIRNRLEEGTGRCVLIKVIGLGEAIQANFLLKCLLSYLPELTGYIYPGGEQAVISGAFPRSFRHFYDQKFQKELEQYQVRDVGVFDDLEIGSQLYPFAKDAFPVSMSLLKPINVLPLGITDKQKNNLQTLCGIRSADRVVTLNSASYGHAVETILLELHTLLDCAKFCDVIFYARRFGFNTDFDALQNIKTGISSLYRDTIPQDNFVFLSEIQERKNQFQYDKPRVILVDRFGVLNYLYAISHVGVVDERHNILEPVIAGARSIFSWQYSNDLARGEKNPISYNTFYGPFLENRGIGFPCRKKKDVRKALESCMDEKGRVDWLDYVTEYQDPRFSLEKYKETLMNIIGSFE